MEKLDLTIRRKHFGRRPRFFRSISEIFEKSFSTYIEIYWRNRKYSEFRIVWFSKNKRNWWSFPRKIYPIIFLEGNFFRKRQVKWKSMVVGCLVKVILKLIVSRVVFIYSYQKQSFIGNFCSAFPALKNWFFTNFVWISDKIIPIFKVTPDFPFFYTATI